MMYVKSSVTVFIAYTCAYGFRQTPALSITTSPNQTKRPAIKAKVFECIKYGSWQLVHLSFRVY